MNEQFATQLLRQIWPSIGGRIQENGWPMAWLPAHIVSVQDIKMPAPLGSCGSYGCVFGTSDPSVVFKLTTDQSEAHVANALFKYLPEQGVEPHPNMIRYFGIYEVPGKMYDGQKIYALWREECPCIGWPMWPKCLFEEATALPRETLVCPEHESCRAVGVHQFNDAVKAVVNGLNKTKRDIARYRAVADRASMGAWAMRDNRRIFPDDSDWWHWLQEQYQKAPEMRAKAESSPGWQPADRRDQLGFMLGGVLYMIEELSQTMFGQGLADLFRWSWQYGIVLGDVHLNNVGVVYASHDVVAAPRRFKAARGTAYLPGLEPRLVVTDPGHALLMDPVYQDIKPEPL